MKVETFDNCKRKLIFEVSAARFEEGLNHAYNKNKTHINVAGFRRGKAPRKLIETQFGREVFYEDAIDYVLPEAYNNALEESGLKAIAQPEFTDFKVQPDKSVVFTAELYVKPEVKLGNYKGLTYTEADVNPTEAEIMAHIEDALEKNSREISITDRPIINGDVVVIDFVGYIDGEAFDGGTGKDFRLIIGSHTFIDNFEDQLIGRKLGDNITIKVRFPDEYHSAELSGKDAEFNVRINEIKLIERPELDDEFASDVSEFDTLDEYKKSIAEKIKAIKIRDSKYDMESQLIRQLIDNSVVDVPGIFIENQMDARIHDFKHQIESRGMVFDKYLEYIGQTEDSLRESYRSSSIEAIKSNFLLTELAKAEGLEADEEELEKQMAQISQANTHDSEKINLDEIRQDIAVEMKLKKALDIIKEHSQVVSHVSS